MSTCAFSLDQLMELAGLSVSQAVFKVHPPTRGRRILVACGPGNNGGDGLVAARHLRHYGYQPSVYYPKRGKNELYQRLTKQLEDLEVPFVDDFGVALSASDHVVDAIFGFSFSGEVREPFPAVIRALAETKVPVTAVDAPSSWDIEHGPPESGHVGSNFNPAVLVSLTAPKPLAKHFKGRHFIGGRYVFFSYIIFVFAQGILLLSIQDKGITWSSPNAGLSRRRSRKNTTSTCPNMTGSTRSPKLQRAAPAPKNSDVVAQRVLSEVSSSFEILPAARWEPLAAALFLVTVRSWFCRLLVPIPRSSYDCTTSRTTVWADGAWTFSIVHFGKFDLCPLRALEQRGMEVMTKCDVYQILFPTDRAFSSVLSAHLGRPVGPPDETVERA
ncbi:hypothetical protein MCOR07_002453 [Pyricularia oryzae]|nr:hypothetical protein MCOR07_002453 [Pyricularia oryzae]